MHSLRDLGTDYVDTLRETVIDQFERCPIVNTSHCSKTGALRTEYTGTTLRDNLGLPDLRSATVSVDA
ncbi:hypothetical protein [Nocardia salmonicida]